MKLTKIKLKNNPKDLLSYFSLEYGMSFQFERYFQYLDYDYIVEINDDDIKQIDELVKHMNKIILKAYDFYCLNLNENLKNQYSFFIKYLNKFKKKDYLIWRYDILIDENWDYKFIEMNANTPGLITDIHNISKLQRPKYTKNYNLKFKNYINSKFKQHKWKKIWILLPLSFEDEDFLVWMDYYNILLKTFEKKDLIIWDIYESNIIDKEIFTIKWEKVDVVLSFFPLEFFLTDINYASDFFDLVINKKIVYYNNFESIVLQDKKIFSTIWDYIDSYDLEDREFIKKHIPFTTSIFQEDEEKYIAKYRFWRMWRSVFDKWFYSKIENKQDFVFQEKINSKIFDEYWNFLVLGVFTDLNKTIWIISRKQSELITNDETNNNKITLVYKK